MEAKLSLENGGLHDEGAEDDDGARGKPKKKRSHGAKDDANGEPRKRRRTGAKADVLCLDDGGIHDGEAKDDGEKRRREAGGIHDGEAKDDGEAPKKRRREAGGIHDGEAKDDGEVSSKPKKRKRRCMRPSARKPSQDNEECEDGSDAGEVHGDLCDEDEEEEDNEPEAMRVMKRPVGSPSLTSPGADGERQEHSRIKK